MRHRTEGRNTEFTIHNGASGAHTAGNIGSTSAIDGTVTALSTARAKLQHRTSLGGANDTAGLGSDQRLMVDQNQKHRFDKLCLDSRTTYDDQRLVREDGSTLRNRPHVTRKFEVVQIIQELLIEYSLASQIFNIFLGKLQIFDVFNQLLNTGNNSYTALIRHRTEEHIKIHRTFTIVGAEKAVSHRQLIKISEHRQIFFSQFIRKNHQQHFLTENSYNYYTRFDNKTQPKKIRRRS